jgi:LPXTG-motif cell wall-anchored protein
VRTRTRFTITLLASAALLAMAAPAVAAPSPTELVYEVVPGTTGGNLGQPFVFDGRLYFTGDVPGGTDLFVSDGSVGSGARLAINPTGASNPSEFTVIGNTLYFSATDGVSGREPWAITGAGAPTLVADIEGGAGDSNPNEFTLFDGDIYFQAYSSVTGQSLYVLSGGTVSHYPMGTLQVPSGFTVFNGYLYLSALGPDNRQLFRLDGTNPPVQFSSTNAPNSGYPHQFAIAGGFLYYLSNTGGAPYNYELFATNGVTAPVQLTTDLADDNGYQYFTVFNDTLYFSAGSAAIGRELGYTTGGAVPAYFDINPGAGASDPEGFTEYNGSLYFSADNGVNGFELFSLTGAAAPVLRADMAPGALNSYPFYFVVSNGRLVFAGSDNGTTWNLWSFDGATAVQETTVNTEPYYFAVLGDYVYYAATSAATGSELWRTRIEPAAAAPALAATGSESLIPAGIGAALLLGGLALALARRRRSETQELNLS